MRKSILLIPLSLFSTLGIATRSYLDDGWEMVTHIWDNVTRWDYLKPAMFKLSDATAELQRADLAQSQMPMQAAPTQRTIRVTLDQRPALRMFTLPRNDFAY
ncbi:hypothetical protein [Deinococcus multiflagellatus]|uniref:Uncharacterized protein n=1 Tax=Deinococcus multiflagellatus TaxID=1656887 RepID=A0ABW1ZES7_9DEIO|nr:hypothetical protein [Deinococcus multiflagellatus]MBZ9712195.1 hypothetical protein [Deinococcus multiflagellatus]